jgi:hypothetical protein
MIKACAVAAVLASLAFPAFAQDAPSLVGTWTGTGEGMAPGGVVSVPITFVVTEQEGRAFRVGVTYEHDGGSHSEPNYGVIAPDGQSVFLATPDAPIIAKLQSETSLDLCYVEDGEDDALAMCARLTKAP